MGVKRFIFLLFLITTTCNLTVIAQNDSILEIKAKTWADSVYNSLSVEQRIAQLIFVRANYPGQPYFSSIDTLIRDFNIGGIVFFKSDPVSQVKQTNHWNKLARTPLMIAIDAEWGLSMRLNNTVRYPLSMTLGAVRNNNYIYAMGKQIGEQCKRMGIHINFAPVVDVNSDPRNPVIGMRSFGQDPELVAEKGLIFARGLESQGIIACAKHYPGHGNTHVDSHYDLPVVTDALSKLRSNDLYPFALLINGGVNSIMIAHLSVPAMDPNVNLPSTLSKIIVSDYLKDTMGFKGLIITDGLDMKGVTKHYKEGEVALKALEAGNDILLIPDNVELSIQNIYNAYLQGDLKEDRIKESCIKVLLNKYLSGAANPNPIKVENLINDLNKPLYNSTAEILTESSITVVKNSDQLLPLGDKFKGRIAMVVIGASNFQEVENEIIKFGSIDIYHLKHDAKKRTRKKLVSKLSEYDLVIATVLNTNISASKKYGISEGDIDFINKLAPQTNVVLDIFASPYALNFFDLTHIESVIVSYHENPAAQRASIKLIMNGAILTGRLPVDAGPYKVGHGLTFGGQELYEVNPNILGINMEYLKKVDSIAKMCIDSMATPGCQILAAKDGAVFYNKSFGYHTYDKVRKVKWNDVYDIASLTKILATTAAIMKMTEEGKIDLNDKISDYLLMLRGTDKSDLGFKEVLSHTSGLQNWIPFYTSTFSEDGWNDSIYSTKISEEYPTRVAEDIYLRKGYDNILFDSIMESPFQDKSYHYSGLGFYMFKKITEDINNINFDKYLYENFYNPLGLKYMRFNPRKYFKLSQIIPTENDTIFRKQLLHGDVHDQGAALLGGVSGNAGLFSNSHNVAVMMQMFLNGGSYAEGKYLESGTIDFFNNYHYVSDSNRRGLGFDKPLLKYEPHRTNCKDASPSSFGHSGFTGTYAWADPETGLVYVFLSNRVHPDMNNGKLMNWDIRTDVHQLFYEAIKTKE